MGTTASKPAGSSNFSCHVAVGAEGAAALVSAEQEDGYLESIQLDRANRISRQSMTYAANRITSAQADVLAERIASFTIPKRLHLKPTVIALMPSADGGMPHTRPSNTICLPQSASALTNATFVHELWHLHQRAHYETWKRFFADQWQWRVYEGDLPPHLEEVRRINPDTMKDPLWIWKNEWVPVCVFLNPVTPELKYTSVWFYNARSRIHYRQPPRDMATFFSSTLTASAYEHPCETSAYMLADGCDPCPAYKALKEQFGDNLQP
jgi:hypothetical protein